MGMLSVSGYNQTGGIRLDSATVAFLWSIADLLRGDFKQSQFGRIILPLTLMRPMEYVLAPTEDVVIRESYA
jgi:type I restriction enzyme M protein